MKKFLLPILFPVLLLTTGMASAQTKAEKKAAASAALLTAIDNRRYVFQAQSVAPTAGRSRVLTTPYSLALRGDTLDTDLPYFGRAYSAGIGSNDGGIRFLTTDFTYTVAPGKKGGREVTLVPKNQNSASKIYLSIGPAGYATLNVQSNNRQAISFSGTVVPGKQQ